MGDVQIIANVVNRDGAEYLDVQEVKVKLALKKMSVIIQDEVNDNVISQAVNQVINENWQDIFQELKPDFERSIGETFKEIMKPIFDAFPYKSMFEE